MASLFKRFAVLVGVVLLLCTVVCVGSAAAAETLTVVYCEDQTTYPFSATVNGNVGITVKDSQNYYYRYYPALESSSPRQAKMILAGTPSSKTWNVVNKVDYINFDANGYFDTGYAPNNNIKIESRFSFSSLRYSLLYYAERQKVGFYLGSGSQTSTGVTYFQYGTDMDITSSFAPELNTVYNLVQDKNKLYINDVLKYTQPTTPTFQSTINLYIGVAYQAPNYIMKGNVYSFKVYNDNLIRDYIPIRVGNGEYALYDKLLTGGVIYHNVLSNALSGGGTPTPLTYSHQEITPDITAVSLTSPTPALYTDAITATVTASSPAGEPVTYQWYVSTNSGSTWSAISGATDAALSYTPTAAGTYTFKVTATNSAGSTDSWTAGFRSVTAKALTNPTFTQQPAFSAAQGTLTAQPSMSFVANANVLGDTSVHIHSNTVQVSGTGGTWQTATTNTFIGGVWTLVQPIHYSDTVGTTHTYTTTVTTFVGESWSDPNKRIIGEVTSEPFSFTTYAAPTIPTVSISPTQIKIATAATVILSAQDVPTAPAGLTYTYKWYYGTSATPAAADIEIGTWSTITTPYSWNIPASLFPSTGTRYIYLQISDSVGNVVKSTPAVLTLSNIAPPTINSVTLTSQTPALIGSSVTASVSAINYHGTTEDLTYKWYYSLSTPVSWTEIGGQTAATLTTSFSAEGTYLIKTVVTDTSISESTDSYSVAKYATVQIVPTPAVSSVAVNPYKLDLSLSTSVQLSSTITNPSGVASLIWQQNKDNGAWTDTALTQGLGSVTVSAEGEYLFRLKVTPLVGSVIYSEPTHSVIAGYKPVISIIQPDDNAEFGLPDTINIRAEGTGVNSISWDFGSGVKASGNTNTLTPWVQYSSLGRHTITLTAGNEIGTSTASVSVKISSAKRPLAVSTPAQIPNSGAILEWADTMTPQSAEDQSPDLWGMFTGLVKPFTSVMGQWFYLALFAVPYLLIWITTRNTMIPSILGILFGAWLLVMLPGTAMTAAVCILVLSVSGGIFGIYLSRRQRE